MKGRGWHLRPLGSGCGRRLRSWLTEPGSLTARCQRHCREFRVRLLFYGRARPLAAEQSTRPLAWVREVVLVCDGTPVIFAHTTLSMPLRGRLKRWLGRLGTRSLGSLLFAHPGFARGPIEFRRLTPADPLFRRAMPYAGAAPVLWARRSAHRLGDQTVVVTEVFLPGIAGLGSGDPGTLQEGYVGPVDLQDMVL